MVLASCIQGPRRHRLMRSHAADKINTGRLLTCGSAWPGLAQHVCDFQVNTAMLLKNLPPHLRSMIVKGKGPIPVHAAAAAAAVQAGRQPPVGSPAVLSHSCYLLLFLSCMQHMFCMTSHQESLACLSLIFVCCACKEWTGDLASAAPQPVSEQGSDRAFSAIQWSSMLHAEDGHS